MTVLDSWIPRSKEGTNVSGPSLGQSKYGLIHMKVFDVYYLNIPEITNICWNEVCDVFDGIYLNWDTSLFKHQLNFHGLVHTAHLSLTVAWLWN